MKETRCISSSVLCLFYHDVRLVGSFTLSFSPLRWSCFNRNFIELSFSISIYSPQLALSHKARPTLYGVLHHLLLRQELFTLWTSLGAVKVSTLQAHISWIKIICTTSYEESKEWPKIFAPRAYWRAATGWNARILLYCCVWSCELYKGQQSNKLLFHE